MSRPFAERIAAAPISWGVCEVPGWGWQYDAATVLDADARAGPGRNRVRARRLPPATRRDRPKVLAEHGLRAVGGFVPVVLHEPGHDPVPAVRTALEAFVAAGAGDAGPRRRDRRATATTSARRSTRTAGRRCWPTSTGWPRRGRGGRHGHAAPARRHDGRERRRGRARARRQRASACAWTPATCSSAAPTRSRWPASTPDAVAPRPPQGRRRRWAARCGPAS